MYTDFQELPVFLSIKDVSKVLQISEPKAREIVYSDGFPIFRRALTGRRILIPKDGFIKWIKNQYQFEDKQDKGGYSYD